MLLNKLTQILLCLIFIFPNQKSKAQVKTNKAPNSDVNKVYERSTKIINDGIEFHKNKQYAEAIAKYNQVHNGDSLYINALYEKGLTYYYMDSLDKGLSIANQLLSLKTSFLKLETYNLKLNILSDQKNYDLVLITCNEALERMPFANHLYIRRGMNYESLNKYDLAYKDYCKSLLLNPSFPNSHYYLGRLFAYMDLPSLSILAFQTFLLTTDNENHLGTGLRDVEKVCKNQHEPIPSITEKAKSDFVSFEESDLIIKSQAALDVKYKSIIDLNYLTSKQLQVILEKLSASNLSNDEAVNFYVNFYKEIWDKQYFESCMLLSFRTLDNAYIQDRIKKNDKKKALFVSWANNYIDKIKTNKKIEINGKSEIFTSYYDGHYIESLGKVDDNNKRQGEWKYYNRNAALISKGIYKDDLVFGTWNYYYEDGSLKKTAEYNEKGELHGKLISYYDNGSVYEDYNYQNGKLHGIAKLYRPDKSLKVIANTNNGDIITKTLYNEYAGLDEFQQFKNGEINGEFKSYHQSGELNILSNYVDGKLSGSSIHYHPNGKVKFEIKYNNDVIEGVMKEYFDNGQLKAESNHVNGKLQGRKITYNESGVLILDENFKDGMFEGPTLIFDSKSRKLAHFNYKKDELLNYIFYDSTGDILHEQKAKNGIVYLTRFNEYRQKIAEGNFSAHGNEGEWTYYFETGIPEMICNYKKGMKEGLEQVYYYNGSKKYEVNYSSDQMNGYYTAWYINGNKEAEGFIINGTLEGAWKRYYENGILSNSSFYNTDKKNGESIDYEPNGKLMQKIIYNAGIIQELIQYDMEMKEYHRAQTDNGNGKLIWKHWNGANYKEFYYKYNGIDSVAKYSDYKNEIYNIEYYKNGKKNGIDKYYYTVPHIKTISSEVNFINDELEGEFRKYHMNGKIWKKDNYKNSELNGRSELYNEAGFLERVSYFKDNKRHGDMIIYTSPTEIALKVHFVSGMPVSYTYLNENNQFVPDIKIIDGGGEIIGYYPNKKISIKYTLLKGFPNGEYLLYYSNGQIMNQETYVNSVRQGKELNYLPNGQLISERNWKDDYRHGVCNLYYPNGKLYITLNYDSDYVHGEALVYDEKGQLIKKENYFYGVAYEK